VGEEGGNENSQNMLKITCFFVLKTISEDNCNQNTPHAIIEWEML